MNAQQLSEKAKAASLACALWLEHPWVAHSAHEAAASAHESIPGHQEQTAHHRKAAQFWAGKENNWTDLTGCKSN